MQPHENWEKNELIVGNGVNTLEAKPMRNELKILDMKSYDIKFSSATFTFYVYWYDRLELRIFYKLWYLVIIWAAKPTKSVWKNVKVISIIKIFLAMKRIFSQHASSLMTRFL